MSLSDDIQKAKDFEEILKLGNSSCSSRKLLKYDSKKLVKGDKKTKEEDEKNTSKNNFKLFPLLHYFHYH